MDFFDELVNGTDRKGATNNSKIIGGKSFSEWDSEWICKGVKQPVYFLV